MAVTIFSLAHLPQILFFFCLVFPVSAQSQTFEFVYNGFNDSKITLDEASIFKPSGALKLTNKTNNIIGHAFYPDPVQMIHKNSSSYPNVTSFSTHFVFAIKPPRSGLGGYGLAFALTPSIQLPGAGAEHFLGLFNASNDGNRTNQIFAVEFDTVNGHNEGSNSNGNHVGINVNSMVSVASEPAAYYFNGTTSIKEEVDLESGDPIQAWIDYDGDKKEVNVTIYPYLEEKPARPLITYPIDLTLILEEWMYVGFSASTGVEASSHYILSWSFAMNGPAPRLDLAQLPPLPIEEDSFLENPLIKILIPTLSAVIVFFIVIFAYFRFYKKMGQHEMLEDWELDCPHRFRYKDLLTATKGFKESELIGAGGFGVVYKGVLPTTGCEVAVKRITRNSTQGMREFAAEIETLGRLRHKNLVNLQGWCKKNNNLLLVYDYIPNGSLDTMLFDSNDNDVLSWEHRFYIIRGVAAGLLYLHEEWEQLVVHRDVKSSNVLIDANMNARLGDFGLARLYEHGEVSHTTSVVGTIGYIAPELARTGKPSASSDVFAYGILLLEVACGRRPVGSNRFILADWVMECHQMERILDTVDPKLNSDYIVEEMELVLQLGILCCHQKEEARPTMRQVTRYLNGDDQLPHMEYLDESIASHMRSKYFETAHMNSFETGPIEIATTYSLSSHGNMSSGSIHAGKYLSM